LKAATHSLRLLSNFQTAKAWFKNLENRKLQSRTIVSETGAGR
jgi:hypothetical protein